MRTTGITRRAEDLRPHDHACWAYDRAESFVPDVLAFLREGLRRGERVGYVGGVALDHMAAEVADLARSEGGDAFVTDLDAMYQGGTPDVDEQVAIYVDATRTALRDGHTGLRVAADCTPLLVDEAAATSFARYEHLVDREMVELPFTALCGLDRSMLGDRVQRLACVHPTTNVERSSFGVFALEPDVLGLRGELDIADEVDLDLALERAGWPGGGPRVIDGTGLGYLDHHALSVLQRRSVDAGTTAVLRCRSHLVGELGELLGYDRVTVEVVG